MSGNPLGGSDDSELIMSYEKRIAEMLLTIQKQERDILYKDEEIKSVKNIARDVAEELAPVKQRELEFHTIIQLREDALKQAEANRMGLLKEIEELKR